MNEIQEEILEQVREIRQLLEGHILSKGELPANVEDRVVDKVREEGAITKKEVKTLLEVTDREALEIMKNLAHDDVSYIAGKGSRRSVLRYTPTKAAKKAVALVKILAEERILSREEIADRLDLDSGQVTTAAKLAKLFSGERLVWRNDRLIQLD